MRLILLIILNIFIWVPVGVLAQNQYAPNSSDGRYQSTGIISGVGTPTNTGTPSNTGTVPAAGTPTLVLTKSLTSHTLTGPQAIDINGVGDNCSAGAQNPEFWSLDPNTPVDDREKLEQVITVAVNSDKRLRQVHVDDDAIDMYYLQPAYRWGFVPMNYYLHISANGTTFHMSLEKPSWLGGSTNYHSQVTDSFSVNAPTLLSNEVVTALGTNGLFVRDAKMIEVVSAIMYQVNVQPIANSYFVCYILPFLIYIIFAILIAVIVIWFIIRRFRRASGFQIHRAGGGDHDSDEDDSPMFPGIRSNK